MSNPIAECKTPDVHLCLMNSGPDLFSKSFFYRRRILIVFFFFFFGRKARCCVHHRGAARHRSGLQPRDMSGTSGPGDGESVSISMRMKLGCPQHHQSLMVYHVYRVVPHS
jgi:hypothetical protein